MTGSVRGALSNERPYRDRALRAVPTIGNRPRGHGARGQARKSKRLGARAFAHPTKVIRFHRDLL